MTTDTKSQKPMPSVAEINAYLELSAARTKLRLPIAKGAAAVVERAATPPAAPAAPALQGSKKLPTQPSGSGSAPAKASPTADAAADEAWRPFSPDDDR